MTKLKNLNCDTSKTKIVTTQKLKLWENSICDNPNCEKTQELKLGQLKYTDCEKKSKNQIVTTQILKLWPNSKNIIGKKIKKNNCDRTLKLK